MIVMVRVFIGEGEFIRPCVELAGRGREEDVDLGRLMQG